MIELKRKVVIITGAAMGLGAATAELMAKAGGKIVIADCNEELGRQQTQKINDAGGTAAFVKTDVSKADEVEAMVCPEFWVNWRRSKLLKRFKGSDAWNRQLAPLSRDYIFHLRVSQGEPCLIRKYLDFSQGYFACWKV